MNKDKEKEVINALADFVIRIAEDENATPEELDALPAVARILLVFA